MVNSICFAFQKMINNTVYRLFIFFSRNSVFEWLSTSNICHLIMSCTVNCTQLGLKYQSETTTQATSINPELSPESVVILTVICVLASMCGTFGNSLVILAVLKSESLRSIPDFVILSLAFSDFTVCFVYLPLSAYKYNHYRSPISHPDSAFSIVTSFFGHISLIGSVTNMFVVTVDRVIAIRFPLKYPSIMTVKTAMFAIAMVWLISFAFGGIYAPEIGVSRFVILSYCIILLLVTISMYAYIFCAARKQENKVHSLNSSTQPNVDQQRAEKKAAKTIFTVVGIYGLCWIPMLLLPIIVNPSTNEMLFKRCFPWVQTALSCNSALNPYVYCLRSRKYRKQFAKLLRLKGAENIHSNTASNTYTRH